MGRRLTQAEFVAMAAAKHGGKYDYSKLHYMNGSSKVEIVCPTHGSFFQRANSHLEGQGCPECAKEARKATCVARYGMAMPAMAPEAREKVRKTNMARYGGENPMASQAVRDKIKSTWLAKYGVDNPQKVAAIREKTAETNIARYGFPCSFSNPDVRAKHAAVMLAKYGVRNSMQVPETRAKAVETWRRKYGVDNPQKAESVRSRSAATCMDRYGVAYPVQCQAVIDKGLATKAARHTFNASGPEDELYLLLVSRFGERGVIRQYSDDARYLFACDFYIPSRDMFIELNASWTHGGFWFEATDPSDRGRARGWKTRAVRQAYYRSALETWTVRDVDKRETARRNNLNYVVFWDLKLRDAAVWFELGCPDGHDWMSPWSWFYD